MGVRMLDGSGKFLPESKRAFPSPIAAFYKLVGLSALFPKSSVFNNYSLGHLNEHENHVVDVLAGAFMLVPKQVLEECGGFDEQFFMYGEDIDLSYRIQKAGFINYYFAQTAIIHFKGESTKKGSLNYVLLFYNAMRIFVQKNYRGGKAGVFAFFIQLAIVFRAFFSIVHQLVLKPIRVLFLVNKTTKSQKIAIISQDNVLTDVSILFPYTASQETSIVYFSPTNYLQLLKEPFVQTILFCEGTGLSWKDIIQITEAFADSGKTLLYHAANSYSIVESDSRETSGKAVAVVK
jgi:hypothetical protein